MKYSLSISGKHYEMLRRHLFPGDGNEAVAIALCGRHSYKGKTKLLVNEIVPIPYESCIVRKPDLINWRTETIIPYLEKAMRKGFGILKIHSHPTGYSNFSSIDDKSDTELFESIFGWMNDDLPHASAVMLPDGEIFGRVFQSDLTHQDLGKINVVGDDLLFWINNTTFNKKEFELRTIQAFGEGTVRKLKQLKIAVIGC